MPLIRSHFCSVRYQHISEFINQVNKPLLVTWSEVWTCGKDTGSGLFGVCGIKS